MPFRQASSSNNIPMNRLILRACLAAAVAVLASAGLRAQSLVRDSVQVVQTPSGEYICCFDLDVRNMQPDSLLRISEFRWRIISGRAQVLPNLTESPANWTLLSQTTKELRWTSNTASADIRRNTSKGGYRMCIADTGIFRVVWETHNIDSMISSDTLTFACRKGQCDEAFFSAIPSQAISAAYVDVSAGNSTGRLVNDVKFHPITPGVQFKTDVVPLPDGWVRLRVKPDTIAFFTNTDALDFNDIVEGFRLEFTGTQPDSAVRVEWWTGNFGDIFCRDTATIRFGLSRRDSLLRTAGEAGESCCIDLVLKNTHAPASAIDRFTLKLTSGARIDSLPLVDAPWRATLVGTDSAVITYAGGLASGDTLELPRLCVNNALGTSDTVRYTWGTFLKGVPVMNAQSHFMCMRPLTACDSLAARVDSTLPATSRCVFLTLRNRNSRRDPITRLALKISNPGTPRRVLSATAPAPWRVAAAGGDSVVFTGGTLLPGAAGSGFSFCTTLEDTATGDPLVIAWTTSHNPGPLCGDTLRVNAIVRVACDSMAARQVADPAGSRCAFQLTVRNRNEKGRTLTRFQFEIGSRDFIIDSAATDAPWAVLTPSFPNFDLDVSGSTLGAGGDATPFTLFIATARPDRPATIPLVWRTFAGDTLVCFDTLRLVCTDAPGQCDSISARDSINRPTYLINYRVENRHTPPGPIDGFRVSLTSARGPIDTSESKWPAGWSIAQATETMVLFRGGPLQPASVPEMFTVALTSGPAPFTDEACTMIGDVVLCCVRTTRPDLGVAGPGMRPSSFSMDVPEPNPASDRVVVPFRIMRAVEVELVLRDVTGRELRRTALGHHEPGEYRHTIDLAGLAAGSYYISIAAGGEFDTRGLVVVR